MEALTCLLGGTAITNATDTHLQRRFTILPMFDADGGERVLTRHTPWPGHVPREHAGKDLDGLQRGLGRDEIDPRRLARWSN